MFSTFCIKMFLIIAIFHMFQTFFLRHEPDLSDRPIFLGILQTQGLTAVVPEVPGLGSWLCLHWPRSHFFVPYNRFPFEIPRRVFFVCAPCQPTSQSLSCTSLPVFPLVKFEIEAGGSPCRYTLANDSLGVSDRSPCGAVRILISFP